MLNQGQRATLAAHIRANTDPDVIAALAIRNDTELARLYNLDSTFVVWRSNILPSEYKAALDWTEVDNMTAGKARVWEWATENQTQPLDATNSNLRAGISQAFGNNTTTTDNLTVLAKRFATVCEEIFATGTGTDQTPGIAEVEGQLTIQIIGQAFAENP